MKQIRNIDEEINRLQEEVQLREKILKSNIELAGTRIRDFIPKGNETNKSSCVQRLQASGFIRQFELRLVERFGERLLQTLGRKLGRILRRDTK